MSDPQPLHATLVSYYGGGVRRGVLLRGPSGAGKSDLALRLISAGWRLAADDRVLVWRSGSRVFGRAPNVLAGLLEVRSVGVLPFAALRISAIDVVIDCIAEPERLERIPEAARTDLYGVLLPLHRIDARSPGAAEKVAAACDRVRL